MRSRGAHFLTPTVPLHVLEADEPGPTALVQAGIHGDGSRASTRSRSCSRLARCGRAGGASSWCPP
ncbi:MAG: hypothetical protein M5U28_54090 [Sandaracinaceae bacterium]|nr:hypothetical protein [Sandaracinaceae bacterium]